MTTPGRQTRPSSGPVGLAGLAVAGVALCCGLPVLLAAGSAVTILGVGLGSWALITTGLVAFTAGGLRWRFGRRGRRSAEHRRPAG